MNVLVYHLFVLYKQMMDLADEAGLSSEKLGELLGVSGLTIRRWKSSAKNADLPPLYERAFSKGVERLVVDGHINPESRLAQSIISEGRVLSFQATLKTLGFSDALKNRKGDPNDAIVEGLSQIGAAPSRVKEVDAGRRKLFNFAKMGAEWKRRIGGLWSVVRSPQLTFMDKLVAYGALFYLLTPFDLIPDYIPVIGLLDDYAVLGLALAYYIKRFPHLFPKEASADPSRA